MRWSGSGTATALSISSSCNPLTILYAAAFPCGRWRATFSRHLGPACPRVRCLGFRSLLVGQGLDGAFAVVNYEQAVELFLKTDRLSDAERAMLMGGACAKAYGWSPKKA
jgi:hypothetical protein